MEKHRLQKRCFSFCIIFNSKGVNMKITIKELKEMIRESVEDVRTSKQEELEAEIKDLLRQVREESGKAGRGEKHKSIDGLFKRIHAAREEKKLLSRDVEPENG
jgi:hypothetical protein